MKDLVISVLSFFLCAFLVFSFIAIGWYLVWKCFLSRFKFIKELFGNNNTDATDANKKHTISRARRMARRAVD